MKFSLEQLVRDIRGRPGFREDSDRGSSSGINHLAALLLRPFVAGEIERLATLASQHQGPKEDGGNQLL